MKQLVYGKFVWIQDNVPKDLRFPNDWIDTYFEYNEDRLKERLGNSYNKILNKFDKLANNLKNNNNIITQNKDFLFLLNEITAQETQYIEKQKITESMSIEAKQQDMEEILKRAMSLSNDNVEIEYDDKQVQGFLQSLYKIFRYNLELNLENIVSLHRSFLSDKSIRKDDENVIIKRIFNESESLPISYGVAGYDVEKCLNLLINSLNKHCNWILNGINIMRIFIFVYDFLCIHPFKNGNGRMSRLLIIWLCRKLGIKCVDYSSIEGIIYNNKNKYNQVINQSMEKWWSEYSPITFNYFDYFFNVLQLSTHQIEVLIDEIQLDDKLLDVVEVIKKMNITFTFSQLVNETNLLPEQLESIITTLSQCNIIKILSDGTIFKYGGVYENS